MSSSSKPTRQCQECTREFEWGGIGRPPSRCDSCKKDAGDRTTAAPAKPRRGQNVLQSSPARTSSIGAAIEQLRDEMQSLELQREQIENAIAALEVVEARRSA